MVSMIPLYLFGGATAAAAAAAVNAAMASGGGSAALGLSSLLGTAALTVGVASYHRNIKGAGSPIDGRVADLIEVSEIQNEVYLTKTGCCGAIAIVSGIDYGSRSEESDTLHAMRKQSLMIFSRHAGAVVKIIASREPRERVIVSTSRNPVLELINQSWQKRFDRTSFRNFYYIIIEFPKGKKKELAETMSSFRENMSQFNLRYLQGDEILKHLGRSLNGRPVAVGSGEDVGERLACARIGFDFERGLVFQREDARERLTVALSVGTWSEVDSPAMFDGVLTLPAEVELLIQLKFHENDKIVPKLKLEKIQATRMFAGSQVAAEYDVLINDAANGADTKVSTQVTLFISGHDEHVLRQHLEEVRTYALMFGHEFRSETSCIEALWRTRLPGVYAAPRERGLRTTNIAAMLRYDAAPTGIDRTDWGHGCIRPYPTLSNSPYPLQFHVDGGKASVGHWVIVGPTGSGKSATALHLITGALNFPDVKALCFDAGQGLRVASEAIGSYVRLGPETELNPLAQLDDAHDEMVVTQFLKILAGARGTEFDEAIARALAAVRDVAPARRTLAGTLTSAFEDGPLRRALAPWAKKTGLAGIFNGSSDALRFEGQLIGVALDDLLEAPDAVAGAIYYIVQRVKRQTRSGDPLLVFIDEAPRLLGHPAFEDAVKDWLLQIRKARGVVGLAFQAPEHILQLRHAAAIKDSCPTFLFLPSYRGDESAYRALGLNDHEITRLKKPDQRRWALLKRPTETVALDVDLSVLGNVIRLYQGGPEPVARMQTAKASHGDEWLWHYLNS